MIRKATTTLRELNYLYKKFFGMEDPEVRDAIAPAPSPHEHLIFLKTVPEDKHDKFIKFLAYKFLASDMRYVDYIKMYFDVNITTDISYLPILNSEKSLNDYVIFIDFLFEFNQRGPIEFKVKELPQFNKYTIQCCMKMDEEISNGLFNITFNTKYYEVGKTVRIESFDVNEIIAQMFSRSDFEEVSFKRFIRSACESYVNEMKERYGNND